MNLISHKIKVIQGDITTLTVDVIVNAANHSLLGGGGVDGAIHRAGGNAILEECKKIIAKQGSCNTGEAVVTTAGNMPSKFVIHTVGPIWHGGNNHEENDLKNCYWNSLKLAVENKCKTIAFPNISTGIYGYPKDKASKTAIAAIRDFMEKDNSIEEVILVCFDRENYELIEKELQSKI